jgi:ATP/maltotriose-dependent transcriptional regulator MalT
VATAGALWGPIVGWESELRDTMMRNAWELGSRNADFIEVLDIIRTAEPVSTEALTERERVVLHYLPTLMSNAEIAAEMVVSVNTVKTHLKSIYRKLGVERRRDALLRARQVELL